MDLMTLIIYYFMLHALNLYTVHYPWIKNRDENIYYERGVNKKTNQECIRSKANCPLWDRKPNTYNLIL